MHVVLVDDDKNILTSLSMTLKGEGFAVDMYEDGFSALEGLKQKPADIGVFDIKMPRINGLELLQRLRVFSNMPVIFLTSKNDVMDELLGLKLGADDYITKPFSQKLLIERIRVVLRRAKIQHVPITREGHNRCVTVCGKLKLDHERHECLWEEQFVNLTVTEFIILNALVQRPGVVKTRDALMDVAYDDQFYIEDRTIDSHIKRVRKKFRQIDPSFESIETLYGLGYRYKDK